MKKTIIIILILFFGSAALAAEPSPVDKTNKQITELKAEIFDYLIQLDRLQQQKNQKMEALVELLKANEKQNKEKEKGKMK